MSLNQVWEGMLMIRAFLRRPDTQQKIAEIEAEAAGSRFAYSLLLTRMYVQEAYPAIARRFGFPGDALDSETFPYLVGPHLRSSLDMAFLWVEVEVLGRQWTGAKDGLNHVNSFRVHHFGMDELADWDHFYSQVSPMEVNRIEAMDFVRNGMSSILYPLS
eukprot:UN4244